ECRPAHFADDRRARAPRNEKKSPVPDWPRAPPSSSLPKHGSSPRASLNDSFPSPPRRRKASDHGGRAHRSPNPPTAYSSSEGASWSAHPRRTSAATRKG